MSSSSTTSSISDALAKEIDSPARVFTYALPFDYGSSPNPYGPALSLTLCKPGIRRVAQVGDYLVAFRPGTFHVVYVAKISEKLTLREYSNRCHQHEEWSVKIASAVNPTGDCQYRFVDGREEPIVNVYGPHVNIHLQGNLGENYCLLSTDFYYFGCGEEVTVLPEDLIDFRSERGLQIAARDTDKENVRSWLEDLRLKYGTKRIVGVPMTREFTFKAGRKDSKGEGNRRPSIPEARSWGGQEGSLPLLVKEEEEDNNTLLTPAPFSLASTGPQEICSETSSLQSASLLSEGKSDELDRRRKTSVSGVNLTTPLRESMEMYVQTSIVDAVVAEYIACQVEPFVQAAIRPLQERIAALEEEVRELKYGKTEG